jgi:GNAT superfamily N-acetyltransferase
MDIFPTGVIADYGYYTQSKRLRKFMSFDHAPYPVNSLVLLPVEIAHTSALHQSCWPHMRYDQVLSLISDSVRRGRHGFAWGLVAQVEGAMIGFGQVARWGNRSEISDLVISPRWRDCGIGTIVIKALLDIARQNKFSEVEIGAIETNQSALRLYRRLGFIEQRRLMLTITEQPEPVIYLSMAIGAERPA